MYLVGQEIHGQEDIKISVPNYRSFQHPLSITRTAMHHILCFCLIHTYIHTYTRPQHSSLCYFCIYYSFTIPGMLYKVCFRWSMDCSIVCLLLKYEIKKLEFVFILETAKYGNKKKIYTVSYECKKYHARSNQNLT